MWAWRCRHSARSFETEISLPAEVAPELEATVIDERIREVWMCRGREVAPRLERSDAVRIDERHEGREPEEHVHHREYESAGLHTLIIPHSHSPDFSDVENLALAVAGGDVDGHLFVDVGMWGKRLAMQPVGDSLLYLVRQLSARG